MLKRLSIQNLALVERADLCFEEGLTVITGETGAGKTALVEALRLLLGERADASKVRRPAKKATLTAAFEGDLCPKLKDLCEAAGVEFSQDEPLIISREISSQSKNRCFVGGQQVPRAFLAKISPLLVEIIGQHAQVWLKKTSIQRDLLDRFAKVDLAPLWRALEREKALSEALNQARDKKRATDLLWLNDQVERLEMLAYEPEEEERLFAAISELAHGETIQTHALAASELADRALATCHELARHLDKLPLQEAHDVAKEIQLQLTDIAAQAGCLASEIESDPGKLAHLEQRLGAIDQAKARFGPDLAGALTSLRSQLDQSDAREEEIKGIERALQMVQADTASAAEQVTTLRKRGADTLGKLLSEGLKQLNIASAEVVISVEPTQRTQMGDDLVIFHLRTNQGEEMAPSQEGSSGGETARLLFCLKGILCKQNAAATLVFDEIDAGVGGETATRMGAHMKELSTRGQVLCVTHFPQVAHYADHHLCVTKFPKGGRTHCEIMQLFDSKQREAELFRMLGGLETLKR